MASMRGLYEFSLLQAQGARAGSLLHVQKRIRGHAVLGVLFTTQCMLSPSGLATLASFVSFVLLHLCCKSVRIVRNPRPKEPLDQPLRSTAGNLNVRHTMVLVIRFTRPRNFSGYRHRVPFSIDV